MWAALIGLLMASRWRYGSLLFLSGEVHSPSLSTAVLWNKDLAGVKAAGEIFRGAKCARVRGRRIEGRMASWMCWKVV